MICFGAQLVTLQSCSVITLNPKHGHFPKSEKLNMRNMNLDLYLLSVFFYLNSYIIYTSYTYHVVLTH